MGAMKEIHQELLDVGLVEAAIAAAEPDCPLMQLAAELVKVRRRLHQAESLADQRGNKVGELEATLQGHSDTYDWCLKKIKNCDERVERANKRLAKLAEKIGSMDLGSV